MATDYYSTLGVSKTASADEIKRAYRKLAHQHHPDKQGGNEAKFKEINEAYQVLSDDKKKQQYDQFGSAGPSFGGGGGGFNFNQDFAQGFGGFNVEDIFDMFGGGFGRQRTETRGQDIAVDLTVSLPEALLGTHKVLELEKIISCETCKGTGGKPGTEMITCKTCEGKGEVKQQMGSLFGKFTRVVECGTCRGVGKIPQETCSTCKGEGRHRGKERLDFELPAGVEEGAELALRGKGQAGFRGATAGNLHFRIHITMPKKLSKKAKELVEELSREL